MWIYDGAWIPTYDTAKMETMILLEIMTIFVETCMIYGLKLKSEDGSHTLKTWECLLFSIMINVVSFIFGFLILFFTGYFNIWWKTWLIIRGGYDIAGNPFRWGIGLERSNGIKNRYAIVRTKADVRLVSWELNDMPRESIWWYVNMNTGVRKRPFNGLRGNWLISRNRTILYFWYMCVVDIYRW